ncbi:ClpP class periplasmic serine protease [Idiomarina sp. A28L]|uniref:protease SohB n=1 Tax=Idiomarina sp. A28L TaxID=1036674 RepID=UPI0002138E91|nr:protease SohB [Idiomarina sp. A28L]EGN76286.1 ClpP class periplasmic serine protease [Idiomarina sp. A28L]
MLELLGEYGIFLLKVATIVIGIMLILGMIINSASRQKKHSGELKIENLSESLKKICEQMKLEMLSDKERKKAKKATKKAKAKEVFDKRVFVIDFKGSMDAHETESLRREVTAILAIADVDKDEVLLRLESPGGVVHGYGLAAAQLKRLRDKGLKLTISVDKVAASGGYMMACIGDRIVAAPFAVLGSIGVLAQIPNFHRLLKKNDIDFEQITAGEYKRTLTLFGKNTDKGREKFQDDIESIHGLFKDFVQEHRTGLNIDDVATGEVWYGQAALDKGLIDDIKTSDDLLLEAIDRAQVFKVTYKEKAKLSERFTQGAQSSIDRLIMDWVQRSKLWRW